MNLSSSYTVLSGKLNPSTAESQPRSIEDELEGLNDFPI